MEISGLYTYPLKSGHSQALNSSSALATGFPGDRSYLLVDEKYRFLSQRSHPAMARLHIESFEPLKMTLDQSSIVVPSSSSSQRACQVKVWSDEVSALDLGDEVAIFLSNKFGSPVRLCKSTDASRRKVKASLTEAQPVEHYFADSFPYLVISQESLDLLNFKLGEQKLAAVSMNRFRPNIVIKGWQAHAEDTLQTLLIGKHVRLRLADPCSRCNVILVDQETGQVNSEPLRTLSQYRKQGSKIYFGMHAWLQTGAGEPISLGDPVQVIE
ncbi:MAG: MOSC domain-containing protein [Proteobacteria bacterium]|nr:MOSC domain-containing protein [Pseudomonadota bacterium]